jgi:two-component system, NarL family, response regulator NreC
MTNPDGNGATWRGLVPSAVEQGWDHRPVPRAGSEAIRGDARNAVRIVLRRSRGRATGRAEAARSAGGPRGFAKAGDVGAALRKMRGHKPDVLELDVNMPGGPSLEAIPNFLEASPRTANVVLPMDDRPQFARAALRAGHWRSCSRTRPTPSMRTLCLPRLPAPYLNPRLGARVATEPEATTRGGRRALDRRREALRLLVLGYANAEIANDLFLSMRTVESHRSHIQHKTGATSRVDSSRTPVSMVCSIRRPSKP